MAVVSGPQADKFESQLDDWYRDKLALLMDNLTSPYPYGSEPLTPLDQFLNFKRMQQDPTGQAYQALVTELESRYAGFKDKHARVEKALQKYFTKMQGYEQQYSQTGQVTAAPQAPAVGEQVHLAHKDALRSSIRLASGGQVT